MALSELCYAIYQMFGQFAVLNFIRDRQNSNQLPQVTWNDCEPCEEWSAFDNDSCLVCGTFLKEITNGQYIPSVS